MTMDTTGIIVFVASAILYFALRKKSGKTAAFFLFTSGIGAGLLIGAFWAITVVDRVINSAFP